VPGTDLGTLLCVDRRHRVWSRYAICREEYSGNQRPRHPIAPGERLRNANLSIDVGLKYARRAVRLSTALRCLRWTKQPLVLTDNLPTIAAMQGALGCRIDAIGQKVYRTVGKPDVGSA